MNIKNVLVPVDFSAASRLAVNYGVSLAREFRAKLTLMHVVESPTMLTVRRPVETAHIEKEHRDQALRMLSALIAPEDQDDLDLGIVIKSGDVKDKISAAIGEQHADIAVMGTHGRGLFGRWLIGSVTESILRNVSIPILTVCRAMQPLTFKRILFATDLSEGSKQGFGFALEMARTMRSDLFLLHVLEKVGHNIDEAQTKLAELVAEGKRCDVRVETAVVKGGAAEEILKAAEDNTAGLILITVRRMGLVERALIGTTAERVVREASVPVLSIPAYTVVGREQLAGIKTRSS